MSTRPKAILALNGGCIKRDSHKLGELISRVQKTAGSIDSFVLDRPEHVPKEIWREECISDFCHRYEVMGSPSSRYGQQSWWRFQDDLFKLDQLCFRLRRLTIGFDWIIGSSWSATSRDEPWIGKPYIEPLCAERDYSPRGPIADIDRKIFGACKTFSELLNLWNFSFGGSEEQVLTSGPSTIVPPIGPMANSFIFQFCEELRNNEVPDQEIVAGVSWMLETVKLDKNAENSLKSLIDITRNYYGEQT